jgi:hypothetical protein
MDIVIVQYFTVFKHLSAENKNLVLWRDLYQFANRLFQLLDGARWLGLQDKKLII